MVLVDALYFSIKNNHDDINQIKKLPLRKNSNNNKNNNKTTTKQTKNKTKQKTKQKKIKKN